MSAFITSLGHFLPGEPISNDCIEDYLGKINGRPSRVKQRILNSNGIQQRYYALDRNQQPTYHNSQMAALAIRNALSSTDLAASEIELLCAATTWADLLVPGFASMVHGELPELPPLEAVTTHGVCCAGVAALKYAAAQVQAGEKRTAIAVASEQPSRLFRHTQFEATGAIQAGQSLPFDTEFLRWMLSDGAGAMVLQNRPNLLGLSLKIEWIELMSHASVYPVCMYAGTTNTTGTQSWMDYPSYVAAAEAGTIHLKQNIRLLEKVMQLGVEGWLQLIEQGQIQPDDVDWLLCHYSSHFFRGQIIELLEKSNCLIPESKWFTNLYTRGNTGCASIYLMLEELFHSGKLQPGQKIFCFVPESGRFTIAYMLLTVVGPSECDQDESVTFKPQVLESIQQEEGNLVAAELLRQLTLVWLEFERKLQSVPIVRKLNRGEFTLADYKALLRTLRPQVVEGARWIARAASNMTDFRLRSLFIGHAQDEHRDYQMLERNYISVGGLLEEITQAEKNLGSEALSAFIFHQASQENPVDLMGSMFIIEGLGNRLAGQWAKQIRKTLNLRAEQVSFLAYHGENDESHIGKLGSMLHSEWMTPAIAQRIVKTAQVTSRLYLMQLEEIGN